MNGADGHADEKREELYIKTAFLERIAHELRGPAGVIQGALQELELALGAEAEAHRALLDMARRGVQRVVRTAERLQQTGQCERGPVQLQRARCDISALVRQSAIDAERFEARRKIAVQLELPAQPLFAEVDARWFGVALFEIASNAIRHAKECVEFRLRGEDGELEMTFQDDGASAAAFEPVRFAAPREARGLGLALAIVRDVIVAHGGELQIDAANPAAHKRGSAVRVRLPKALVAASRAGA